MPRTVTRRDAGGVAQRRDKGTAAVPRALLVGGRDPANELYDRACDLLDAAQGLRAAADREEASEAIPATLGCLEASLAGLVGAVAGMGGCAPKARTGPRSRRAEDGEAWPQIRALFDQLARDLMVARASCASVRAISNPSRAKGG